MVKTKTNFFGMHIERLIYVLEFHNNWKNKKVGASCSMCGCWPHIKPCGRFQYTKNGCHYSILSFLMSWRSQFGVHWICCHGIQSIGNKIYHLGGKTLGKYFNNIKKKDPRFCLGMDRKHGGIFIIKVPRMNEGVEVSIDFEKYPVICHFRASPQHLIGDYQTYKVWRNILKSFNKSSRKIKVKLNKVFGEKKR